LTNKFLPSKASAALPGAGRRYVTTVFEDLWLAMARGEFTRSSGTRMRQDHAQHPAGPGTRRCAAIVDNQAIEGPSPDRAVIFQSHRRRRGARSWATSPMRCRRSGATCEGEVRAMAQKFIDLRAHRRRAQSARRAPAA
jgi:nitrate/nitrite transport system ATP-binding protein